MTKREEILQVAAALFAERGYLSTTLDDIAEKMGFTKPALYYYFSSKEEMLVEIFEQIMDRYAASARAVAESDLPPPVKLRRLLENHIEQVVTNTAWTTIFFQEEGNLPQGKREEIRRAKREYDRLIEQVYEQGVRGGVFQEADPHVVVSGIIGLANWLYTWYDPRGRVPPEEVKRLYWEMVSRGCLARRGRARSTGRGPGRKARPRG